MIVKQIKLSSQSKDRLGRLKGKTGIKNWNVLCRWAFCYSLGEYSMPTDIPVNTDSNVEMSWFTSVSYTHLTLPTIQLSCRSRWSPYH